MTLSHHPLTAALVVSAFAMSITACGGDDGRGEGAKSATAASCAKSWNAATNADQQATLAGVAAVDILLDDKYRVGTWPQGQWTVRVNAGFSDKSAGDAVVKKNSCVVLLPDSRLGQMAFAEGQGKKWVFVREKSAFPKAAAKSVAGARSAEPDALGKLKLN